MKVILAGFNLDREAVQEHRRLLGDALRVLDGSELARSSSEVADLVSAIRDLLSRDLTPETISAAYARISRDPRPVDQLRRVARDQVDRARTSNQSIIFGLGHASVAEHAVFNLDLIGISRLAIEAIERTRLASYTEKSQRYVRLGVDYVVPEEIRGGELEESFREHVGRCFGVYDELFTQLRDHFSRLHPDLAADPKNEKLIEGMAKEDARYCLPLAATGQLGMTANARTIEDLLQRTGAHPLAEVREFNARLLESIQGIAPSLIKYTEPGPHLRRTRSELRSWVAGLPAAAPDESPDEVRLLRRPAEGERWIAAAMAFSEGTGEMTDLLRALTDEPRNVAFLLELAQSHLDPFDKVLREYELAEYTFELIVSAACFGQLKRHRMATVLAQDYDPRLGITVPPAVQTVGRAGLLRDLANGAEALSARIAREAPAAANYPLLNAHRRRVILGANLREVYHLVRLRADKHAQWDIRGMAERMAELVREDAPTAAGDLFGKDEFETRHT